MYEIFIYNKIIQFLHTMYVKYNLKTVRGEKGLGDHLENVCNLF